MKSLKRQKKNRILIRKDRGNLPVKWLKEKVEKLLQFQGFEGVEVSLYFTDDATIRQINHTYRKKDKATDVLSFELREQVGDYNLLGEIIISVETAQRQAVELGHSLEQEVKRLIVHGFVHLLGYDHERSQEEEALFRELEERLLSQL